VQADKNEFRTSLVRGDVFAETSAKILGHDSAAKILDSFAALGLYTQARP
jgi:hypothetical protein